MSQKSKVNITKITAKSRPQAAAAADPTKPKTQTKPTQTQTKPAETQTKQQAKAAKAKIKAKTKAKTKAAKAKAKATKSATPEKPLKQVFLLARPFVALGRYLRDSWRELRQVRWPNRKATWKMTLAVLVYCAIFIIFIMLLDALFTFIFDLLLKTNA